MSIKTEIKRIKDLVTDSFAAVTQMGGVSNTKKLADLPSAIKGIPLGIDTSDATASASYILSPYTAYVKGEKITGTMTSCSSGSPTVSDEGIITGDAGFYHSGVSKRLPTQAATTVTPSTSDKVAVSGQKWTTGDVKVKGDTNLIASNIAYGKQIFGVSGTVPHTTLVTVTFNFSGLTSGAYKLVYPNVRTSSSGFPYCGSVLMENLDESGTKTFTTSLLSTFGVIATGTTKHNLSMAMTARSNSNYRLYTTLVAGSGGNSAVTINYTVTYSSVSALFIVIHTNSSMTVDDFKDGTIAISIGKANGGSLS